MNGLRQDLRYAWRVLRRAPGFTATALLALAPGIGVSVAVLTLVEGGGERPPMNPADPRAALVAVGPGIDLPSGTERSHTSVVRTIAEAQDAGLDALLRIFGGTALLLLGITCVTLMILLLARAITRRAEIALRSTLGARRGRLLRQLLTEGILLGFLGGVPGLLFGAAGIALLHGSWPAGLVRWLGWDVSGLAIALALGIPLLVTLAFGLVPLRAAWRRDLHALLTTGGRATAGPAEGLLRKGLIVLAVAASLILLSGAGLLLRSFGATENPRAGDGPGFDARSTLTLRLDLPEKLYPDNAARSARLEQILQRVGEVPGVEAESLSSMGAWQGLGTEARVRTVCPECAKGGMILPIVRGTSRYHAVSAGFFAALGAPVLRGREFTHADRGGVEGVAIINEAFANQLFPNGEPLGKQIQVGGEGDRWLTVVGIVGEIRARGIGSGYAPVPAVYLSALQHPPTSTGLAVRTAADPTRYEAVLRKVVREVAPAATISDAITMEQRLARFVAPLRWFALISGALATLAILLTALGLYGVIAFQVAQRTREIGVRVACGADVRAILRLIVGEGLRLVGIGAVIGMIGALSLARLLQLLFSGVRPLDPVVYGTVALLLVAVALLASARPGWRAARVDPALALRANYSRSFLR